MLMFLTSNYRWILFIGGWVLIGVGNLWRVRSNTMVQDRSLNILRGHPADEWSPLEGDMKPSGCLLTLIGILMLIAWVISFVGVTF